MIGLRRLCSLGVVALAVVLVAHAPGGARTLRAEDAASQDAYEDVLREFRKKIKAKSVEGAVDAIRLLDPANPRSLPELLALLKANHWMLRGAAMKALSRIPSGPLRAELRLTLITDEHTWIREGVAYAMLMDPRPGDADALVGAMDDAEWRVRRTAARALGSIVSRAGVERLVVALESDDDLRVRVWARDSLRAISGRDMGLAAERWRAWFEVHKDADNWVRQGEEVVLEEFDGVPFRTVTVEADATTKEERERRDKLPDLFVLSPFGFDHGFFRPYLDEAAAFIRVHYVTLPSIQELTGRSGYGAGVPRYPAKRLAKALDKLRKETGKEQIVVLGDGATGWIAEQYALLYPRRTAGLVISNGWLDSKSYGRALARLSVKGTTTERWVANLLLGNLEPRHDVLEGQRIRRIMLSHRFSDRRDSEAYRIATMSGRDDGFAIVPDLAFTRHLKVHTPTLFYFPDESPMTGGSPGELRRIRDSFKKPPPLIAVMRETRGLAHIERPAEFLRVLHGFLRHAGILNADR